MNVMLKVCQPVLPILERRASPQILLTYPCPFNTLCLLLIEYKHNREEGRDCMKRAGFLALRQTDIEKTR